MSLTSTWRKPLPNVPYRVKKFDGEEIEITTPGELPDDGHDYILEPIVSINFMVPADYVGAVMQLATERRGEFKHQDYLGANRCVLNYRMPLAEVVYDLFDKLKSATSGYGTMDFDVVGYEESDLVKVDILVHHNPCDALPLSATAPWPKAVAGRSSSNCVKKSRVTNSK